MPRLARFARNACCPVWLSGEPDEVAIWEVTQTLVPVHSFAQSL